jgi:hypothetical protein
VQQNYTHDGDSDVAFLLACDASDDDGGSPCADEEVTEDEVVTAVNACARDAVWWHRWLRIRYNEPSEYK